MHVFISGDYCQPQVSIHYYHSNKQIYDYECMFAAVATITSVSSFQDDEVVPRKSGEHVEVLIRMLKSATQQKEAILRNNLIVSPTSKKKLSFVHV